MPGSTLKYLALFAAALSLLTGCRVLQTIVPPAGDAALQAQRIAQAEVRLADLEEIEVVLQLNNRWLERRLERRLQSHISTQSQYALRRVNVDFGRQVGLLSMSLDIGDGQGNVIAASVSGEITLDFNGSQLQWYPLLHSFDITSRDFSFAGKVYTEPEPGLADRTQAEFKTAVLQALVDDGANAIQLSAVPLAEIGVGASLPGISSTPATASSTLRGVFMVAGSAILIGPRVTTIALDMTFIPDLSTCPADVTVSRAGFVREIKDREPVGMASKMDDSGDISYFYSEITGAEQPLSIIHYWFADGQPVSAEELPVGPSHRWRTWSDRGSAGADAGRWDVLVVEKESGCILHSQALRSPEPGLDLSPVDPAEARHAYSRFEAAFTDRVSALASIAQEPEIAQLGVMRPFYGRVLQAAMADLSLDARFDAAALAPLTFEARLHAMDASGVECERRECPQPPVCRANLAQCKRLRDTRDCSYCKFRNPLNNRCVNVVIDPLCEASRKRLNDKYEADRAACLAEAEAQKRECDELAAQTLRSCQIESGFQGSVCEAVKDSLASLEAGTSLARVEARSTVEGALVANFSNFRIGTGLGDLELDMSLLPQLRLAGSMAFQPEDETAPLASCIADWSGSYKTRIDTAPDVSRLLSNFGEDNGGLAARWSGFGLSLAVRPSPLRAVFSGNPQLLANCRIGLTPGKVEQAIFGNEADFFMGSLELLVQPLPTTIHLAPATIGSGDATYSATPKLDARALRYDFIE